MGSMLPGKPEEFLKSGDYAASEGRLSVTFRPCGSAGAVISATSTWP